MNKVFKSSLGNRQWCECSVIDNGVLITADSRVAIYAPKLPKPVHRGTITIKIKDNK